MSMDLHDPGISTLTTFNWSSSGIYTSPANFWGSTAGASGAADSFYFYPSTSNISGTIQVFGYNG
jgi:hypothetical protein